jgi:hypothetical protein
MYPMYLLASSASLAADSAVSIYYSQPVQCGSGSSWKNIFFKNHALHMIPALQV